MKIRTKCFWQYKL